MGHFHKQPPRWPNIFGKVISDSEWRDGSFIVRRTRSAIPRDQKVTNSRHIMAPTLHFSRGLKAKAPGAVTACVPASTPLVEIFTGPSTEQKATMVKVTIFFFTFEGLSSVWLLFYQRSDTALLLWVSPDSWLAMFHSRRCSYIRTDNPSTKARARRAFTVSWNIGVFVHSSSMVIFPHRRPRHRSSPSKSPPSFVALALQQDETSSLLDRGRHVSHQMYSSYQLVSHLGTSTTLFPAIWTKTAWSIEELFSQWKRPKRASSNQRTDEEDTSETCNNDHVGGRALTNA